MPSKTQPDRPKSPPASASLPSRPRQRRAGSARPVPPVVAADEPPVQPQAKGRGKAKPQAAAAAPAAAPAEPKSPSRRGTAKSRLRQAVPLLADEAPVPVVAEAVAVSQPADAAAPEQPAAKPGRRRRRAAPHAVADVEAHAPAPQGAAADVRSLDEGLLFGRYAVLLPGDEPAEVTLRSSAAGTALCTCLDFALSEDASCPHVQAVLTHVQADPGRADAWAAGPQAVASRIGLQHAATKRLLWLPGTESPPALAQLAQQLLTAQELDDQALPQLLRLARESGHDLQVDEAVWAHLALRRDARWRVHRLEALLPQGPGSAALAGLRPESLLPLQLEGALFAVCAGRCILADDAVLQPVQQALAAAELLRRHFGVERVLILAAGDALERWRRLLPTGDAGWSLLALDHLAGDRELHCELAPELVIVEEPADGGLWVDADRAAALLRLPPALAIVLPAAGWLDRPAELPLRLAFVDAARLGAYAGLLQAHGVRDAEGQLCGLQDLDTLRSTLEAVLLMRLRDEVLSQLPERVDRLVGVGLPAAERDRHAALSAALQSTLQRWQGVGWWPDSAQRQLVAQVQDLRRLCAGDGAPGVAAAKGDAVLALLNGADAPVAKLVVFSQWPLALQALQQQLLAAGAGARCWLAGDDQATRSAAVQAFQADADVRVLLVADAGGGSLELHRPSVQVLHLDCPWNPRVLNRRFGRVHRRGKAHLVPVTHLVAEASFEHRLHRLQALMAERPDPTHDLLDATAAEGFVQGPALTQWLSDLAGLLDTAPDQAVPT